MGRLVTVTDSHGNLNVPKAASAFPQPSLLQIQLPDLGERGSRTSDGVNPSTEDFRMASGEDTTESASFS